MADYSREDLIALARREAQRVGLTPDLVPAFLGLIHQESRWNPKAVSPAGAQGLGQLMPGTARDLGVKDAFDPVQNIAGAARYFKQQLDRFGDVGLALAAYNWGPGRVSKLVDDPRSVRIPKETLDYVPSVLKNALQFGSNLAPTNATLAFFPGSGQVVKQAVDTGVAARTGAAGAEDIAATIKRGGAADAAAKIRPSAIPAGSPGAPPVATEVGTPPVIPGGLPPMAAVTSDKAVRNVRSLDEYLKQQFGPMAAMADPFPKSYDDKLMRLIDQA